ncbi:hypothetical protein J6590_016809 [Homalodisca vitripennis]|nr:hypothetical protein J6590_016809 [Homalodisca vitripennis]
MSKEHFIVGLQRVGQGYNRPLALKSFLHRGNIQMKRKNCSCPDITSADNKAREQRRSTDGREQQGGEKRARLLCANFQHANLNYTSSWR